MVTAKPIAFMMARPRPDFPLAQWLKPVVSATARAIRRSRRVKVVREQDKPRIDGSTDHGRHREYPVCPEPIRQTGNGDDGERGLR